MKVSLKLPVALTAAVSLTTPPPVHCFQIAGWNHLPSSSLSLSSALHAKSAKQKKTKASSPPTTGGGFGKALASPAAAAKDDDDYSAFPALETKVQETILPVQGGEVHSKGETLLPAEIQGRLDQIYGFRQFNYASPQEHEEGVSVSFGDTLAANDDEGRSDLLQKPSATAAVDKSTSNRAAADLPLSSLALFSKIRVLHVDPLVIAVDNFFTDEECDRYVSMSQAPTSSKNSNAPIMTRSKTVGKDALAKAQRTSTTWFHHYKEVPELMAKASRLLGLDGIKNWEEPQTVRYRRNERFTWHLDALAPLENLESLGGQRTATLLVYLTELSAADGGATMFRDLTDSNGTLRVRPKKGSALLFFPAAGGIPNVPFDIRTLHCGEVVAEDASQDKWIAQLWLRKGSYKPTAPPGNTHEAAYDAISNYCTAY